MNDSIQGEEIEERRDDREEEDTQNSQEPLIKDRSSLKRKQERIREESDEVELCYDVPKAAIIPANISKKPPEDDDGNEEEWSDIEGEIEKQIKVEKIKTDDVNDTAEKLEKGINNNEDIKDRYSKTEITLVKIPKNGYCMIQATIRSLELLNKKPPKQQEILERATEELKNYKMTSKLTLWNR